MRDSLEAQSAQLRLAAANILLERLIHDLKQPLNHIRVTAQDVRLDVTKYRLEVDSLPESMSEIEMAVDRLTLNIDRLRSFSRQFAAEMPRKPVEVIRIIEQALGHIRSRHQQIDISESVAPDLAQARVDSFAAELGLGELLDNAVYAVLEAGRQEPRLEISAARRDDQIVFAVGDNGRGVADEDRPKIFEPFFTNNCDSAGLGLSLALALAKQVGGRIELSQSSDQGSVFELCLPGV